DHEPANGAAGGRPHSPAVPHGITYSPGTSAPTRASGADRSRLAHPSFAGAAPQHVDLVLRQSALGRRPHRVPLAPPAAVTPSLLGALEGRRWGAAAANTTRLARHLSRRGRTGSAQGPRTLLSRCSHLGPRTPGAHPLQKQPPYLEADHSGCPFRRLERGLPHGPGPAPRSRAT